MKIRVENIIPDPDQPRKTFDMAHIIELRGSVESLGLIQPITVRPQKDGKYMIVVGERRFRATQLDGRDEIECLIREDVDDKKAREMQFAENEEQESVPPFELGAAFISYREHYKVSQQELATSVGIGLDRIRRYESLHKITPRAQDYVKDGRLDARTASEVAKVTDVIAQEKLADVIVERDLGRPTVERIIPLMKAAPQRSIDSIVEQVRYSIETEKANHRELVNEFKRQSIPKPAPAEGKYRTITIDPPWPIEKILRNVRPNQFDIEYPTMTMDEIAELPVPDLASEDGCHIYLWTTHKHLPDALDLLLGWGARYQCLLTWVKNVGMTPFSWMYSTEHCLFARIGDLPLLQMGKRLDFSAKVREHSRKPDEFYDLVKTVSPEPRLDMFGREQRDEFTVWGNEVSKFNKDKVEV